MFIWMLGGLSIDQQDLEADVIKVTPIMALKAPESIV